MNENKKVLISWDELKTLIIEFLDLADKEDVVTLRPALAWFDAQPDIGLMDINELLGHKERVLSKMETTENDMISVHTKWNRGV